MRFHNKKRTATSRNNITAEQSASICAAYLMISSTTLSTVLTVSSIISAPPLTVSLIPSPTRLTSVSLSSRLLVTSFFDVVVAVTPEDVEPELSSFLEQPAEHNAAKAKTS